MKIFWNLCFWMIWFWQWCIQRLSDAGILAWVPKLCAQIKGKVIQNNVTYLIISSMQMHLHVLRHFRVCYSKMLKKNFFFMALFLWMGFNCLKATATSRRQFTFYHSVPRNSWCSFYRPWKDERLSRPWRHQVVLNAGHLDWESSVLTTRPLLKYLQDCKRYRVILRMNSRLKS